MTSTPSLPTEKSLDALQTWREDIFDVVIRIVAITASVAYIANLLLTYKTSSAELLFAYTIAYLLILISAFASRVPTLYRIYIFIIIIFAVGVLSSLEYAAIGDGRVWIILAVFLAVVFLGQKVGLFFTIFATSVWALIGYLFIASIIPEPTVTNQFTFSTWVGITISLFAVSIIATFSISALLSKLNMSVEESQSLAKKSEEQGKELAKQHATLERRTATLDISAKISRKLASLIAHESILKQTPTLLRAEFELNSAAIFLLEPDNVLRLASSKGWNEQVYPAKDYRLSLDEDIVGLAIKEKEAYTNVNARIGLQSILPTTRAHVALPLRGRKGVVGALVLQSTTRDFFGEERVDILQIFADQAALLLDNASLLAQRESAIKAERQAYGSMTQSAWKNFLQSQNYGAYRRDEKGLSLLPAKAFVHSDEGKVECEHVPIRIRGKIIGYVDAHKPKNRAWTASEKELLHILTSRLETAMDGARLYQDSQEQAEKDRIINKTSVRMRESLDVKGVLKIAANELRENLGIAEAEVWLTDNYLQEDHADSVFESAEKEDE